MGCIKLHILDEQYKQTELKVSYGKKELTSNFCAVNRRSGMLIRFIDPDGRETRVAQNEDGTYRVIGGELNKDRNIYVYSQDKDGNYTVKGNSIGIFPTCHCIFFCSLSLATREWDSPSPLRSFCLQVSTTHQRRSGNGEVISALCVVLTVSSKFLHVVILLCEAVRF
jgi:hypothetical protein